MKQTQIKTQVFTGNPETTCSPFKLESHSLGFRSCGKKLANTLQVCRL